MNDFKPPRHNPFVITLANLSLPFILRSAKLTVEPTQNCLETFRKLKGKPTVVLANHGDRFDPVIAYALSRHCGERFYFLAARELFDAGWQSFGMQGVGAYSVIRGGADRISAEKTISYAIAAENKVFTFPEGDVTGRDDRILPLKEDGIRNSFEAQKRLMRQGDGDSLYLLPVAIFYEVEERDIPLIYEQLADLERLMELRVNGTLRTNGAQPPASHDAASLEERCMRLISLLIEYLEHNYRLTTSNRDNPADRINQICRQIITGTARYLKVNLNSQEKEAALLYGLRGSIRDALSNEEAGECKYERRLMRDKRGQLKAFLDELDHVQQWLILASTIQQNQFTPEMAFRLVDRLDLQFRGTAKPSAHRTARVEAASPIDMYKLMGEYRRDSRLAIYRADSLIRLYINEALQGMRRGGHLIEEPSMAA